MSSYGKDTKSYGTDLSTHQNPSFEAIENGLPLPNESTPLVQNGKRKTKDGLKKIMCAAEEMKDRISQKKIPDLRTMDRRDLLNHLKVIVLFIFTVACTLIFATNPEESFDIKQFSVSHDQDAYHVVEDFSTQLQVLKLYIAGDISPLVPNKNTQNLTITLSTNNGTHIRELKFGLRNKYRSESKLVRYLDLSNSDVGSFIMVKVSTTANYSTPVSIATRFLSAEVKNSVAYASIILVAVYVLIIFELIHRAMAAMLGALSALATLAALNEKPSLEQVAEWLDYETLCLLFGMMLLVAIFCESGFFDWAAVMAYKLAKGRVWPLISILCVFSAIVSAFLDNVTTILLLTPVTIRLCEVLKLDPKHILMAEVLFSNIGGTMTGVGDPPNVIIVSNSDINQRGIDFANFTAHMSVGTIVISIFAYLLLRLMYRKKELLKADVPQEVAEMRHESEIWRKASARIVVTSREETIVKALLLHKVSELEQEAEQMMQETHRSDGEVDFQTHVDELEQKYGIRDQVLLLKSGVVLFVVIICFFTSSFIEEMNLTIGWIAVIGAMWLLILSDYSDLDAALHRIEWATLLFFAGLFILMKALEDLGLIAAIADTTTSLIKGVSEEYRLAVAIILIVWVAGVASSFIDNIPFTAAMVPVILQLTSDCSLQLPITPLILALAFGACLGGNGTIIGASANVVCAGIAESHGYGFTFWEFFKVGFPMMLVTNFIAMIYLLICHVAFEWHAPSLCITLSPTELLQLTMGG